MKTSKRVVPRWMLKNKRIAGSAQDGSREFISLLACICADGTALPPALIYQGASGDLQDSWLQDFNAFSEAAYFTASIKGWTNEKLGLDWLQRVFDRHTKEKAGNAKRMLIVDGHSSHINMGFINHCYENKIILVVLPPHSTHRLQPLDIGIFSPLATAYSRQLDARMSTSYGYNGITKRDFWSMFREAWQNAITKKNIESAFAAGGIWPLDPDRVLQTLKKRTPPTSSNDDESTIQTPISARGVRRTLKRIKRGELAPDASMDLMVKSMEQLSFRNELLIHENRGLNAALIDEKKKRKRGKPMGLLAPDQPGQAQFFSPAKIEAVRVRKEAQDAQVEEDRARKAREKLEKEFQRNRKKEQAQIDRENKTRERAEKKAAAEAEKQHKKMQQDLDKQRKLEAQELKNREMQARSPKRQRRALELVEEVEEVAGVFGRRGRRIKLPPRFRE